MGNTTHPAKAQTFLDSAGVSKKIVEYERGEIIFSQGYRCASVMYLQKGRVKVSALSDTGREAVVAMLGPGKFFGEGCLAGQPCHIGSATAIRHSTVLVIEKTYMIKVLREQHALSDRFRSHMLSRNVRIEEELIGQLVNTNEVRLAQILLLLARYGTQEKPQRMVPTVSQSTLSKMVGTTRSRVNVIMNKFNRLGFIHYNGDLDSRMQINDSLLSVVLRN